jgi:hypothetical protein
VAGENLSRADRDHGCEKNLTSTLGLLKEKNVKCTDDLLGDAGDLHVSLDVESGAISYV